MGVNGSPASAILFTSMPFTLDFDDDNPVGESEHGEELFPGDIVGKSIYTSFYDNNGFLNWFYGRFNENGQWDGNVVLNAFCGNGNLIAILEATYQNGVLVADELI